MSIVLTIGTLVSLITKVTINPTQLSAEQLNKTCIFNNFQRSSIDPTVTFLTCLLKYCLLFDFAEIIWAHFLMP